MTQVIKDWFGRAYICGKLLAISHSSLTLSSPGFFGSTQPGGGGGEGAQSTPHHNFFVIGRIMIKLGKLVKCFKLYLMIGFWWVNWL